MFYGTRCSDSLCLTSAVGDFIGDYAVLSKVVVTGYNRSALVLNDVRLNTLKFMTANREVTIEALGMDKLTENKLDIVKVPDEWAGHFVQDCIKFEGLPTALLIGMDRQDLFPKSVDLLKVGTGWMQAWKSVLSNEHLISGNAKTHIQVLEKVKLGENECHMDKIVTCNLI